jgi:uncharacterized membrane protein
MAPAIPIYQSGWRWVLLALATAAYSTALLADTPMRSPFVTALLAQRPVAALSHFGGSALALAIGGFQLLAWLRRRYTPVHRWMGRLYVLGVALGGLSGLFMAWHAHGGVVGQLGFALLGLSWLGCTAAGVACIRAGDVAEHRRWMIRSFGLTFAAVTLRLYMPASQVAGISFDLAYPVIAWLCWVPNLVVAEWIARGAAALPRPMRLPAGELS